LEEAGYLNDSQYALERAFLLRETRHLGDLRITADLKSHGINATIITYVLSEVEKRSPQEESLRHLVKAWAGKQGEPRTLAQVKRLYDHCHRRGFPSALIRQSLDTVFEGIEWPR
jgi:SOS response regulatory protein OraA/RecX